MLPNGLFTHCNFASCAGGEWKSLLCPQPFIFSSAQQESADSPSVFLPPRPSIRSRVKAMPGHATDSPSLPWAINHPIGTVFSSSAKLSLPSSSSSSSKNPSLLSFFKTDGQQQAHRRGLLRCSSAAPPPSGVSHCFLLCQCCISDMLLTICSSL